jgi:hypothetical protein
MITVLIQPYVRLSIDFCHPLYSKKNTLSLVIFETTFKDYSSKSLTLISSEWRSILFNVKAGVPMTFDKNQQY